jgi:hypothetical protein
MHDAVLFGVARPGTGTVSVVDASGRHTVSVSADGAFAYPLSNEAVQHGGDSLATLDVTDSSGRVVSMAVQR